MTLTKSHAILVTLALVSGLTSAAKGADRYFYYDGQKGYYCEKPKVYREGCYVVRDETNVVRVNGYPVMSSGRADSLCGSTPPQDDCPCPPTGGDCYPRLISPCNCPGAPTSTPISFDYGQPKVVCDKTYFYDGIGVIKGTIPVPQICVTAKETFKFRPRVLKYDCTDADIASGEGCDGVDCDHANCGDKYCEVKSCEVYCKVENCEKTCKLCPREGELLIAIRKGGKLADVFIGQPGAAFYPEYPRNLLVLKASSEARVRDKLKNPNISFADIISGSTSNDLIASL